MTLLNRLQSVGFAENLGFKCLTSLSKTTKKIKHFKLLLKMDVKQKSYVHTKNFSFLTAIKQLHFF